MRPFGELRLICRLSVNTEQRRRYDWAAVNADGAVFLFPAEPHCAPHISSAWYKPFAHSRPAFVELSYRFEATRVANIWMNLKVEL